MRRQPHCAETLSPLAGGGIGAMRFAYCTLRSSGRFVRLRSWRRVCAENGVRQLSRRMTERGCASKLSGGAVAPGHADGGDAVAGGGAHVELAIADHAQACARRTARIRSGPASDRPGFRQDRPVCPRVAPSLASSRPATALAMVSGVDPAMKGTKAATLRCGHSWAAAWPQIHTSANRLATILLGATASPSRFPAISPQTMRTSRESPSAPEAEICCTAH